VCGNKELNIFCDMGLMPLVNNLKVSPEKEDVKFPLVVNECLLCTHKQLSVAVDRELLFKDYLYQTGTSISHLDFLIDFSQSLNHYGNTAIDIGCNDGTLLSCLKMEGWFVMGIEPCKDLYEIAIKREVHVLNEFFPLQADIGMKFDLITAFNVFAHNDDPKTFLIEASKLLKDKGRIYILTTPARLDNFYHEHISYFTPQSMMVLAQKCGVEVVSFKTAPMHRESYLFEIRKIDTARRGTARLGMARPCKETQGNFVVYGASASEIVLLNYYNLKPEYVVDDNHLKQGKFIPGINSPIVSAEHFSKDPRDLNIICAHNLFDEISVKIKKLRPNKNDRFERII